MKKTQHIVIIGATSSIAEHCARLWVVDDNIKLTLVGRNGEKTAQVAADLKIRNPSSIIQTMVGQFNDTHAITKLANQIISQDEIAIVLIAHGSLPDQVRAEQDLQACSDALMINGISPVLFAEALPFTCKKPIRAALQSSALLQETGDANPIIYTAPPKASLTDMPRDCSIALPIPMCALF